MTRIDDPNTVTVVQVAPAVRAAWAEPFGLSPEFATHQAHGGGSARAWASTMCSTPNFAADLTIMEEGSEFLERFTHKKQLPLADVHLLLPGLGALSQVAVSRADGGSFSTAKSPQQMFGAIAKTYFAEKIGIDPKRLFVVSIMPCVAKKSECTLPTMTTASDGIPDVDVVASPRASWTSCSARTISFPMSICRRRSSTHPLGSGTGAAVVFGATGGVMDAALRSAYYLVTGEEPRSRRLHRRARHGRLEGGELRPFLRRARCSVAVVQRPRQRAEAALCP